jgi:hypothetical protein
VNCLVATDAANSLTIASVYVPTAVKVLAVTAALVTAEQQADKKSFVAHNYSVVKNKNGI